MNLGAVFPQAEFTRVDPDELVTFVQRLEDAGYDHLLAYDHVLGADSDARADWKGFYDHRDPFLEPLMLFAYLARACTLEFVTDVLVLPQRQTALVAKQVATLGRPRAGPGAPRGGDRVERRRVRRTRRRLPETRDAHRGADRAAAPALDRAVGRPCRCQRHHRGRRHRSASPTADPHLARNRDRATRTGARRSTGRRLAPDARCPARLGIRRGLGDRPRRGGRGGTRSRVDRARGQRPGAGGRGGTSARSGGTAGATAVPVRSR